MMRIELLDAESNVLSLIDTTDPATELEFYGPQIGAVSWREWQSPAPTIDELKLAKWNQIKGRRDREDAGPVEYKGKLFDFDDKAREKIRTAREALETAAELGQPVESFEWTCADNSTTQMTLYDFKMIPLLVAIRSDANHQKARQLRAAIDAASTPEDLVLVSWEPLPEPEPEGGEA